VTRVSEAAGPVPAVDGLEWVWNEPPRPWVPLDLQALWAYRELLYFLAWRDIKVRYKQLDLPHFGGRVKARPR
jgi:hypothetical protein